MKPVRSFLIIFSALPILFSQVGCSGARPQPTPDFFRIATQSSVAPTPKATIQPSPSPTNTVHISQTSCLGKGIAGDRIWSSDGIFFAIGSPSGVYLYDGATFQELQFFRIPNAYLFFAPDNQLLTIVKGDNGIQMWDVKTGQLLQTFKISTYQLQATAMSPDGRIIAFGSGKNNTVTLFDTRTGQQLHEVTGFEPIGDIAFSSDSMLLVAHGFKYVLSWRTDTWSLSNILIISAAQVALSPDGHELATVSEDVESEDFVGRMTRGSTFTTIDVKTRAVLQTIDVQPDKILAVVYSPTGIPLGVSTSKDGTRLWDLENGQVLQTFATSADDWSKVVFSPNGRIIAFDNYQHPGLWDVATGQKITELTGFTDTVSALAISPDGQKLISGSVNNGELMITDLNTNTILHTINLKDNRSIASATFSPDGQYVIFGGYALFTNSEKPAVILHILDVQSGQVVYNLPENISAAVYSPNGRVLAVVADKQIQLWNAADNQLLYTLSDTQAYVYNIAFSPDNRYLVTSRKNENIKIWDAKTGQFMRELQVSPTQLAFHPNGHVLALITDDAINLIDIETGQFLWASSIEYADYVVFSPDGQKVFEIAYDNTAKMLDAANGQLLSSLNTPDFAVSRIAIYPNNHTVVTGGYNGRICFWEIP